MMTFMQELELVLPFTNPTTPDQQDAQNTTALVWFAKRGLRPKLAQQIREHIELVHSCPDDTALHSSVVY